MTSLVEGAVPESGDSLLHKAERDDEGVELSAFADSGLDHRDLPPLTDYVSKLRFWWHVLQWPSLVVVVNVFIVCFLFTFDIEVEREYYDEVDGYHDEFHQSRTANTKHLDDNKLKVKSMVLRNFLVAGILLVLDAALLFRGGCRVEKQVVALENDEMKAVSSSVTSSLVNAHAKASKLMDNFLSQRRPHALPKVTLFVNLLFALSVTTFSGGLLTFLDAAILSTSAHADKTCFGIGNTVQNETTAPAPNLDNVPVAVKEWALGEYIDGRVFLTDGGGTSAVHMVDGTTFFAGTFPGEDEGLRQGRWHQPLLMEATPNGSLRTHREIANPTQFINVTGDINECQAFCLAFSAIEKDIVDDYGKSEERILCYDARNRALRTASPLASSDPNTYLSSGFWFGVLPDESGLLWVKSQQYFHSPDVRRDSTNIHKLPVDTMNLTLVASWSSGETLPREDWGVEECSDVLFLINTVFAGVATLASSMWLLKAKKIPSSVVPVCVYVPTLLYFLQVELGFISGLLTTIGAAVMLFGYRIPSWLSRDMVLWGLYTNIALLAIMTLIDEDGNAEFFQWILGLLLVVIGFVLNHPLLQMFGWVGAIITVAMTVMTFVAPDGGEILMLIPFAIVVSCGLASTGYYLSRYRVYLIVYGRRLWRALEATGSDRSQQREKDGDTLRSGLLHQQ